MNASSIGVIIPAFNRGRLATEAIASVAAQTLPPTRLVIVDDGSIDDTATVIQQWLAAHPLPFPATLVRQPNGGPSAARNRGAVEAGDCEFLAFLDSDDLWPADFLARTGGALAAAPAVVAVTCDKLECTEGSGRTRLHRFAHLQGDVAGILLQRGPPSPTTTLLRTAAFRAVGGFDRAIIKCEDYDLMLRLSLRGPWLYAPGNPVIYRCAAGNAQLSATIGRTVDNVLMRAGMLERFVHEHGGAAVIPRRCWQRRLGHEWYKAGLRCREAGRAAAARTCFKRAVWNDPWACRARWALWRVGARPETRTSQTS